MQKLIRVYPRGWTGNSTEELNKLLANGWEVKFITPIGDGLHDYILAKDLITEEVTNAHDKR